jgi:hypothetical protein
MSTAHLVTTRRAALPAESPSPSSDPSVETFRERRWPRDSADALFFLLAGPFVMGFALLLFALPGFAAFGCLRTAGWDAESAGIGGYLAGLAALLDVSLLLYAPAFRRAAVDRDGLLFTRHLGPQKRVAWSDLVRVSVASRAEVFLLVWLFPGVPPKGSAGCGTVRQLLLEWRGGRYYFAPRDLDGFVEAVRRHRPDLVAALRRSEWN